MEPTAESLTLDTSDKTEAIAQIKAYIADNDYGAADRVASLNDLNLKDFADDMHASVGDNPKEVEIGPCGCGEVH